jgi:Uma2 family endonuclease
MTTAQKLMTVEEFQLLPDSPSGARMELVRGVVVIAPPADTGHGKRAFRIGKFLDRFVEKHGLGDAGFPLSGFELPVATIFE